VRLSVHGGLTLKGTVRIQGSKNAGQKIIPAVATLSSVVTIRNCSLVDDNRVLLQILEHLGAKVSIQGSTVVIDPRPIEPRSISRDLTRKSTGTFVFAGALLRRFGHVRIGSPGGDQLGSRPVDFHLAAFEALGARCRREGDYYALASDHLSPAAYTFPHKSANGTVNAVLAAASSKGDSLFSNPDRDPDIDNFLELMRAAGTEVEYGPEGSLHVGGALDEGDQDPISITMVPDRNDAATWLVIAAVVGDDLVLTDLPPTSQLNALTDLMRELGVSVTLSDGEARVSRLQADNAMKSCLDVLTAPFPGISTDWGPLVQVLLSLAHGEFTFTETVFAERFAQLQGLVDMGAAIRYLPIDLATERYRFPMPDNKPHSIGISGPSSLSGARVTATDIRAGGALLVAALAAQGHTVIDSAQHLRRGYEDLPRRLRSVGADISDYLDGR
jgi:UDP-N-acetylglucosamine 1-carboxyvinyltransferase